MKKIFLLGYEHFHWLGFRKQALLPPDRRPVYARVRDVLNRGMDVSHFFNNYTDKLSYKRTAQKDR
ncbi:MAG: hypothetical protein AAF990_13035 [Bacteroidota bacterium]